MKRIYLLLLLICTAACNDKPVSEEDREAIRREIEYRTPVKISQEQIITKTFEEARRDLKDTVVTQYSWKTYFVKPADSLLAELWLAYQYAVDNRDSTVENVQLNDSVVIFTRPVVANDSLQKMLVAVIPKKEIILKLTAQ